MTFEKIRELIVDQLGIDEDMVEMDTNLMKDLEGDSLDMVEIILGIEETFGLEIPDEEAEKFVLQRYIISQYQERCRKKLKQGYRKNEKEAFWEFLAKRPEILNKNTVKAISEKEFKNDGDFNAFEEANCWANEKYEELEENEDITGIYPIDCGVSY